MLLQILPGARVHNDGFCMGLGRSDKARAGQIRVVVDVPAIHGVRIELEEVAKARTETTSYDVFTHIVSALPYTRRHARYGEVGGGQRQKNEVGSVTLPIGVAVIGTALALPHLARQRSKLEA